MTKYGVKFQNSPIANARLSNGLSSVVLVKNDSSNMYGLKTIQEVKNFEDLNGIKLSSFADYDNLNEQSMLATADLPQMS